MVKRTLKVRDLIDADGVTHRVILKWSDDRTLAEKGASWYLVIDGKTFFPAKTEGVTSDDLAKVWANAQMALRGWRLPR